LIKLIGIRGIDISKVATGEIATGEIATGESATGAAGDGAGVGSGVGSEVIICEVAAASKHVDTSDGKLALQHESASQNIANTPGYMVLPLSHRPAGLK
jgi:hypothetical protein